MEPLGYVLLSTTISPHLEDLIGQKIQHKINIGLSYRNSSKFRVLNATLLGTEQHEALNAPTRHEPYDDNK